MKKLLLVSSMLLTGLAGFAQLNQWVEQTTKFTNPSSGVKSICVVDTNVVWLTGYDGAPGSTGDGRKDYSRTIDGGANWAIDSIPTTTAWDFAQLFATSGDHAWALMYNTVLNNQGQIWTTIDGGQNWTQQGLTTFTNSQSFADFIYFWNDTDGVVIGDPVNGVWEMYTTSNAGGTWDSVHAANIPALTDADEIAYLDNFAVWGDTMWFTSNRDRVWRSIDRGQTWTVAPIGVGFTQGTSIDLCFYSSLNGISRYYNDTTATQMAASTSDGGDTWQILNFTGDLMSRSIKHVPGTALSLVSTGLNANAPNIIGSSYSLDGGNNWTTIETGIQRGVLGIADSITMWCGGFTASPISGGVYKYITIDPVLCTDPAVSPGTSSANDTAICGGETVTFTSVGVFSPIQGDYSGVSWVLSTADISGSSDPTVEPSVIAGSGIIFPAPSTSTSPFTNDGGIIDGVLQPYGVYYFTPVVYGNATSINPPPGIVLDLTMDPSCTYTGNSVALNVLDPADPICTGVGVNEVKANKLSVYSSMKDRSTIDVLINSAAYGKVSLQIIDVTGRVVNTSEFYVAKGSNHQLINAEILAAGTYIIKAEVNGNTAVNKIIK